MNPKSIGFTLNGESHSTAAPPLTPLVDVLRDEFFLTGAKVPCREGICGACIVLLDDRPVVSCLAPIGIIEGCSIRTVESLAVDGRPSPVQEALEEHDVVQCGMCFPGMVMTLTSFLQQNPKPRREEIKAALIGNICRCTGYERVIDAALSLAGGESR